VNNYRQLMDTYAQMQQVTAAKVRRWLLLILFITVTIA